MRTSDILCPRTGEKIGEWIRDGSRLRAVYYGQEQAEQQKTHMIMGDIKPYQSMIDGSEITSRSQHKSHLRQHGMIEVGNEIKHLTKNVGPLKPPPGLKETLLRNWDEVTRKRR